MQFDKQSESVQEASLALELRGGLRKNERGVCVRVSSCGETSKRKRRPWSRKNTNADEFRYERQVGSN